MKYGQPPKSLGLFEIECIEMMFYQYMPIKIPGIIQPIYEPRLNCFDKLIGIICCDFIGEFGLDKYVNSYVYISAKYLFQNKGCSYNRLGWHSDGFMTDDINYLWSDKNPTIFNGSDFNLTMNDVLSINEMSNQALIQNDFTFPDNSLLRLNQYNIHRVSEIKNDCMRAFIKVSFSKDKYDLIGNSHNYLLDYNWDMKPRKSGRNIPQSVLNSNK